MNAKAVGSSNRMTSQAGVIVVVDDDLTHGASVASAVAPLAREVKRASTCSEALTIVAGKTPDLIILDLGLPDGDGIDVLRKVRELGDTPVLVFSGRASEDDKVALLDAGADDYVVKPIGQAELTARVRALLRRAALPPGGNEAPHVVTADDAVIDFTERTVTRRGESRALTPTESALLRLLVLNEGRTMTHRELWDAVWGQAYGNAQLHLRVHVTHLRRKIERDPAQPRLIVTEAGVGYRFERP